MRHMITLKDWSFGEIEKLLKLAAKVKKNPDDYKKIMKRKTLIMIFEKPSLRTRVSFETGATQLGGHAIYYDMSTSPMGSGKETIHDTVKTMSRYVNIIMARLYKHKDIEEMAEYASVPVINALTDYSHPCQILADLQTIYQCKGKLNGLKLAYLGDSNNNVTRSLMFGCAHVGINISIGCPEGAEYKPDELSVKAAEAISEKSGSSVSVTCDAVEAVSNADVVYTDSWMSYHIPKEQLEERVKVFKSYQVTADLMKGAASDAIFMNCLPALRGYEQTADVIDGPQSVVFNQAENRLHAQKALMIFLLEKGGKNKES